MSNLAPMKNCPGDAMYSKTISFSNILDTQFERFSYTFLKFSLIFMNMQIR